MKHNSLYSSQLLAALVVSGFAVISAPAQPAPPQGALRFANASAEPDKIMVMIDTAKLRPDGFGPGDTTGAIGILAGAHKLTASAAGGKPTEASVTIQPNTATTIVAYSKAVIDPLTRKPVNQLQLFTETDPPREKGKQFRMLFVSARPAADVTINGQAKNLPALKTVKIDNVARGAVKVEAAGKPVFDFTAEESGSFLIIIFDKPDGTVGGVMLPDYG